MVITIKFNSGDYNSPHLHSCLPMDNDGQTWPHICYRQSSVWTWGVVGWDTSYKTDVEVTSDSQLILKCPENQWNPTCPLFTVYTWLRLLVFQLELLLQVQQTRTK